MTTECVSLDNGMLFPGYDDVKQFSMCNQLKFQGSLNVKWVNFFSGLDTMAKRSHTVISQSILDHAREDSERLDWLTVPYDQRIVDDDTLEWLCGTSKLLEDVVPLAEEKENQDRSVLSSMLLLEVTNRVSTSRRSVSVLSWQAPLKGTSLPILKLTLSGLWWPLMPGEHGEVPQNLKILFQQTSCHVLMQEFSTKGSHCLS